MPFGQVSTHFPQATHFSSSTVAIPSLMERAPNWQAATQEPSPRHPCEQALSPRPGTITA